MSKYAVETKLKAIELYKKGLGSREIQCELNITSHSTIDGWIILFKKYGKAGLITKRTRKKYSGQFKLDWRKEHNESYQATTLKYGISNTGIIANWQRAYKEGGIDALFIKQGRPTMHKKAKHEK
ncbi:helix-turn-helix domain-containing protein [Lactobacillus taiwanensis]|uniref:helix-turn-helix domain-containing protein n=1 Tax=Lactobacillus taiwanensis TaxID=508451 RepID=UPI0025A54AD8|nr:transposase [Lactobacillus taiwanensis]